MKQFVLTIFTCSFLYFMQAQNTVGLLSYNPSKSYNGYTLIYPHNQPNVYLIDNCGEVVHTWLDEDNFRPGNTAYLTEEGNLVKTKREANVSSDPIWAGGGGGIVEILDWDGQLLWSFSLNDSTQRLHHDIALTDKGTILMIVWEYKTVEEAIEAGRDTTGFYHDGPIWSDKIIEVRPDLNTGDFEIVWEWRAWDHLVQDHDSTKSNFGIVQNRPNRININYGDDPAEDWLHSNAIDFNPFLNQILLSVPEFHEIWIIDHSTTTAEASTGEGGRSGKGGDLMYRWGNPRAFNGGTSDDQKLFYQHDAHWIDDNLNVAHPFFGMVGVFNNRVGADYSTVNVLSPAWDMYSWSYEGLNGQYLPADFLWSYKRPDSTKMHSTGLSSVQFQPNGNALICVGRHGYSFEISTEEEIVWEYRTPLIRGRKATQGDSLMINDNLTFRSYRYPSDHSAFDGRDLEAKGFIELQPDTSFCPRIISSTSTLQSSDLTIFPNPTSSLVTIKWEGKSMVPYRVINAQGKMVDGGMLNGGQKYLDVSTWRNGLYFVQVNGSITGHLVIL